MDVSKTMPDRKQLQREGYALLHQAIPTEWLDHLRAVFDAGVRPSEQWPVPRDRDWRYSMLDDDPKIQAVCRLPQLLAVAGELIGERFFLSQVEGREPVANGGHQQLHRDLSAQRPGDIAVALAFLTITAPRTARHGSFLAAIAPCRTHYLSTSTTSHAPYSFAAVPVTSWYSMSIWCMRAA